MSQPCTARDKRRSRKWRQVIADTQQDHAERPGRHALQRLRRHGTAKRNPDQDEDDARKRRGNVGLTTGQRRDGDENHRPGKPADRNPEIGENRATNDTEQKRFAETAENVAGSQRHPIVMSIPLHLSSRGPQPIYPGRSIRSAAGAVRLYIPRRLDGDAKPLPHFCRWRTDCSFLGPACMVAALSPESSWPATRLT